MFLAANIVDLAQAADHAVAGGVCGGGDQVEREEMAVGAGLRSARTLVQPLVAIARDRLDRADRRRHMRLHEPERGGNVAPFREGRDLEAGTVAGPPHAGGADQLPGRHDRADVLHVEILPEREHLRAGGRLAGEPGKIIGARLAVGGPGGEGGRGEESRQRKRRDQK